MKDVANSMKIRVDEGDITIDRSGRFPIVTLSAGLKERLCTPFKYTVIVNLLGRSIGYKSLCTKLEGIWNMIGVKVLDVSNGYFMMPLQYYSEDIIGPLGEVMGKVIRVDYNTSELQKGWFARLVVTVDLDKPLVPKFSIDGEEFSVEYENLDNICFGCGRYGHSHSFCSWKPKEVLDRKKKTCFVWKNGRFQNF
ncbi:hypothetical protein K2173_004898 [Erythroxylum novogranatense]|uniref:Zinc knuckle CX2CX4HX4C domain-containing protein n=1 Tax=Erythroxylum novogranatense TaxID=1862640 RepID=A0AAV8TB07_9ROSI|nr:hypothetical protein K2173_004898 [Erythroxylum novogranatense]